MVSGMTQSLRYLFTLTQLKNKNHIITTEKKTTVASFQK